MYKTIFALILLPLPLLATPCNQATRLVIEAFDLGEQPSVYAQQLALLEQALRLCPEHVDAHNNLGAVLEKAQNDTQALYHFQRASQLAPADYRAWISIGDIYYKQGQYPLSLEAYLKVCIRNSTARIQQINKLLAKNRYRSVEGNNVFRKESLDVLYDKQRLKKLRDMLSDCRSRYRGFDIAPSFKPNSLLDTFVVYRNVYFKVGRFDLTATTKPQLTAIANSLLTKGATSIQVSGHSDRQPFAGLSPEDSDRRNLILSQQRAAAVANALAQRGVPINRMIPIGYSYTQPADGYTQDDWEKNRRVEIELSTAD